MNIQETRRLLEMAYLYAWGNQGSADLRDEWRKLYETANVGRLTNHGGQTFTWANKE